MQIRASPQATAGGRVRFRSVRRHAGRVWLRRVDADRIHEPPHAVLVRHVEALPAVGQVDPGLPLQHAGIDTVAPAVAEPLQARELLTDVSHRRVTALLEAPNNIADVDHGVHGQRPVAACSAPWRRSQRCCRWGFSRRSPALGGQGLRRHHFVGSPPPGGGTAIQSRSGSPAQELASAGPPGCHQDSRPTKGIVTVALSSSLLGGRPGATPPVTGGLRGFTYAA